VTRDVFNSPFRAPVILCIPALLLLLLCGTLSLVAALRTINMSSLSLPESGMRTRPPASAPVKSSPVGKVQPYFIQHKRDRVQAFDENEQQLEGLTTEQFLERLAVSDNLFPSKIPDPPNGLSIDGFCSLANEIALSIKARRGHRLLCIYLFLDDTCFLTRFSER
jgi:hypothetical protein